MSIRDRVLYHWPTVVILAVGVVVATFFLLGFGRTIPTVHMTVFVYRDVNRNGIYDLADHQYAGQAVTLIRPDGDTVEKVSNLSGFTNFDMGHSRWYGDLNAPGEYTVRVEPPPGWQVTSGNASQTITVSEREASATGLVANTTYDAVGVAPDLRISGALGEAGSDAAGVRLRAQSPHGTIESVEIAEDGTFSFPVSRGDWRLELSSHGKAMVTRDVTVQDYPVVLSRLSATAIPHGPHGPQRITVNFDDVTPSDTLQEIPNGYAGVNWRNWVSTHEKLYGGDGFVNAAVSSEYVAYTSAGHPATISSASTFDFVGAYVTALWPGTAEYDAIIRAWRGDELVYEDRFRPKAAGPEFFAADYRGISKLEFSSDGYWQVAVDDIVISTD